MVKRTAFIGIFCLLPLKSIMAQSVNDRVLQIKSLLKLVTQRSEEVKVITASSKAILSESQIPLSELEPSLKGQWQYIDQDTLPTSSLADQSSQNQTLSLIAGKQWGLGVKTNLSWSQTTESAKNYLGQSEDQNSSQISFQISTQPFRDLYGRRLYWTQQQVQHKTLSQKVEQSCQIKNLLVLALSDLNQLLEVQQTLSLQGQLCKQIARQTQKLTSRRRTGAASPSDLMISQKSGLQCEAEISQHQKQEYELKQALQVRWGLQPETWSGWDIDSYLAVVKSIYNWSSEQPAYKLKEHQQLKLLTSQTEAQAAEAQSLTAQAMSDLSLQLEIGQRKINGDNLGSQADESESFPFIGATVSMGLPLANIAQRQRSIAARARLQARKHQLNHIQKTMSSQVAVDLHGLKQDFVAYENFKKSVELSRKIVKEAQKNFSNGRINLQTLTESQKDFIQSQKQLGQLRTRIVARTISVADAYGFFDEVSSGGDL